MLNINKIGIVKWTLILSLLTVCLATGHAYAQGGSGGGGSGGSSVLYGPGTCSSKDAIATAVLAKANNVWYFGIQVTGTDSEGAWYIRYEKNGVVTSDNSPTNPTNPASPYIFSSGWLSYGASAIKGEGQVTFSAVASKTTGGFCTVSIGIKT